MNQPAVVSFLLHFVILMQPYHLIQDSVGYSAASGAHISVSLLLSAQPHRLIKRIPHWH